MDEESMRVFGREMEAWKATVAERSATRALNLDPSSKRLTPIKLRDLKSDMKRTTTLLRRLREFKHDQKDVVLQDITTLNLNRFVTEAAQNIVASVLEGRTKTADIPNLVAVCSVLHQLYETFTVDLLTEVRKKWVIANLHNPANDTQEPARVRVMTRFMSELWLAGVTTEWKLFRWIIGQVVQAPTPAGTTPTPATVTVTLSVVNVIAKTIGPALYGAGVWPPEGDTSELALAIARLQHSDELLSTPAAATEICKVILDFATVCNNILKQSCSELEDIWKQNMDAIHATGELPENLKEQFGAKKKVCDKLYSVLQPLTTTFPDKTAIVLDDVPTLEKLTAANQKDTPSSSIVFLSGLANFYTVGEIAWSSANLFDTEEEQQFYEEFDDLPVLVDDAVVEYRQDVKDGKLPGPPPCGWSQPEDQDYDAVERLLAGISSHCSGTPNYQHIASSVQRWAAEFTSSNMALSQYRTKGNRDIGRNFLTGCKKRLLKTMKDATSSNRTAVLWLCRLAALFNQSSETTLCDIGEHFTKNVEEDLQKLLLVDKSSSATDLRNKKALTSMLCEATKFKLLQTGGILRIITACVEENTLKKVPHVRLILAQMLDSIGTFLMRNPMTRARFESILLGLTKTIRQVGGEDEIQLGACIKKCTDVVSTAEPEKPLEFKKKETKDSLRPPKERYLRHLVFSELGGKTAWNNTWKTVVRQLLKFNWQDRVERQLITKILRKSSKVRYGQLRALANVIAGVSEVYDSVGNWIVDDIIERLRQDLELSNPQHRRTPQKRLVDLKLFGELYNAEVVHESTVFYVLYLIALHRIDYDATTDYSRLRLICGLIDVVSHNLLDTITGRKRMQHFLLHFYVLVHQKQQPMPVDVNFTISEMTENVRSYYPTNVAFERFPPTEADAQKLLDRARKGLSGGGGGGGSGRSRRRRDRGAASDPVNSYPDFFTYATSHCLHPIVEGDEFYGFDEEDEYEEGDAAGQQQQQQSQQQLDPQTSSNTSNVAQEQHSADVVEIDDAKERKAQQDAERAARRKAERQAMEEDEEFEKLFRDVTKDTHDAVRHQTAIKSMSGGGQRRTVNVAPHLMQLQSVLQRPEYSGSLGKAATTGSETVSIGLVTRNKAGGRGSGSNFVAVKKIAIPKSVSLVATQQQNIQMSKLEEQSHRRAVLNRVRDIQKEDIENEISKR
eukprot:PhM_4_TR18692/c1_g1_i1/m.19147/K14327/UPF2, RENT2; regulator of nonsense transcripts 2